MKTYQTIKTLLLNVCIGTVVISAKAGDKDIVDTAVSAGSFKTRLRSGLLQLRKQLADSFEQPKTTETR